MLGSPAARIADVTDGLSNTIALGEFSAVSDWYYESNPEGAEGPGYGADTRGGGAAGYNPVDKASKRTWRWGGNLGWGMMRGVNKYGAHATSDPYPQEQRGGDFTPNCLASRHPGGAHILRGDGGVSFFKDTMNLDVLNAWGTPRSGEVISTSF
jgi:hypothetical protein